MMNLRNYTTREFAEMIDENATVMIQLMRDCRSCSYVSNPTEAIQAKVNRSTIKAENKEIVSDFIYENLYNRPAHRTYSTRGYSVKLRG